MIDIHTHSRFIRPDRSRGDREFFVAGVQPEMQGGGGGVITLVYRDTGYIKRVPFDKAEAFFKTARPL